MPGKPPPRPICCIIDRILVKSLTSLPTSFSWWPEPAAMRRRRLGELESRLGFLRSAVVMELIMASQRLS